MTITQLYELKTVREKALNDYPTMISAHARSHLNLMLTTVLQPRCALCNENHRLPDRLCHACKVSIASTHRNALNEALSGCRISPYQRQKTREKNHSDLTEAQRQHENLSALDTVVAAFDYQGAIPELITRWKYQGMIELTDYIAGLIAERAAIGALSMPDHNLVTVVPSHWQRRLARGFDPVWLLANALAKRSVIDKPLSTLKPSRRMPYQHLKRIDERHIDADHFLAKGRVCGKKILLLDDVITSGSTLNAAAIALKSVGAQSISGFTIALAKTSAIALDEIAEK